jgi:hypothetical protein
MKKITIITFVVFMVEAILHYNQGAKTTGIPPKNEFIKLALLVLVFSFINSAIIKNIS